jgi:hypothetical protein
MADLELTRTSGGRRTYALDGIGTLRLQGFASRRATAEAAAASWRIARRGFWQGRIEATDLLRRTSARRYRFGPHPPHATTRPPPATHLGPLHIGA